MRQDLSICAASSLLVTSGSIKRLIVCWKRLFQNSSSISIPVYAPISTIGFPLSTPAYSSTSSGEFRTRLFQFVCVWPLVLGLFVELCFQLGCEEFYGRLEC